MYLIITKLFHMKLQKIQEIKTHFFLSFRLLWSSVSESYSSSHELWIEVMKLLHTSRVLSHELHFIITLKKHTDVYYTQGVSSVWCFVIIDLIDRVFSTFLCSWWVVLEHQQNDVVGWLFFCSFSQFKRSVRFTSSCLDMSCVSQSNI